ncbi:hypothetical protein AHAS_Ahas19G0078000 [Arachis hypogaea]
MGLRIPSIKRAAKTISKGLEVPKGYLAVYVGDNMRRFMALHSLSCGDFPSCFQSNGIVEKQHNTTPWQSEDQYLNTFFLSTRAFPCSFHSLHTQEKWGKASFSAKQAISKFVSKFVQVPKGYLAVYVGDNQKRYVIPISYLNQASF